VNWRLRTTRSVALGAAVVSAGCWAVDSREVDVLPVTPSLGGADDAGAKPETTEPVGSGNDGSADGGARASEADSAGQEIDDTPGTVGSRLEVEASELAFGSVVVGGSTTLEVLLQNRGDQPLSVALSLSGEGAAALSIVEACASGILPGASCAAQIRFAPPSARGYLA
jgi:hypothetical protein